MEWQVIHLVYSCIGICMFSFLSYRDVQARNVKKTVFYAFIGLSLLLDSVFTYFFPFPLVYMVSTLISFVFGSLVGVIAEKFHLVKKGDREAFILLSLFSPFFSVPCFFEQNLLLYPLPIYIFDLMFNFIFLLVLVPIGLFLYNGVRFLIHPSLYKRYSGFQAYPFIFFLGIPYPLAKLRKKASEKFFILEEKLLDGWHINFKIFLSEDVKTRNKKTIEVARENEKQNLLLQPTLPILLFLLMSMILFLSLGNAPLLLFSWMRAIF